MAQFTTIVFNGTTYNIPNPHAVNWGQFVTDFLVSIAAGTLQPSGGLFTLASEVDFGSSFGLKAKYYKSKSSNIAATGILRLSNTDGITWRNGINSADNTLSVSPSNELLFNGAPIVSSGSAVWGAITGTLSNQSDLQAALDTKFDTVGSFGSSPDANGISVSGTTITLQPSDATHPGAITTGTQTIAGLKTFTSQVTIIHDAAISALGAVNIKAGGSGPVGGYPLSFYSDPTQSNRSMAIYGPPTIATSFAIQFPDGDGGIDQVWASNGSGTLSWMTIPEIVARTSSNGNSTSILPTTIYTPTSQKQYRVDLNAVTTTNGNFDPVIPVYFWTNPNGEARRVQFEIENESVVNTIVPKANTPIKYFVSVGTQASQTVTIVDYSMLAGATLTINLGVVTGPTIVLTEGIDWTASVSNANTASSLLDAIVNTSAYHYLQINGGSGTVDLFSLIGGTVGNGITISSSDDTNMSVAGGASPQNFTGGLNDYTGAYSVYVAVERLSA